MRLRRAPATCSPSCSPNRVTCAGALDWATVGVERCIQLGDDAELQLLLRLRYRIRVDLGLKEDDYDHMLDVTHPEAEPVNESGAGASSARPALR